MIIDMGRPRRNERESGHHGIQLSGVPANAPANTPASIPAKVWRDQKESGGKGEVPGEGGSRVITRRSGNDS